MFIDDDPRIFLQPRNLLNECVAVINTAKGELRKRLMQPGASDVKTRIEASLEWWNEQEQIVQTTVETIGFPSSTIEAKCEVDEYREWLKTLRVEHVKSMPDPAFWQKPAELPPGQREQALKTFEHADDYSWIIFRRKTYALTPNQIIIIKFIHLAMIAGNPFVTKARLCEELGASESDPRDSFRKHPVNKELWQNFVLSEHGRYRLAI